MSKDWHMVLGSSLVLGMWLLDLPPNKVLSAALLFLVPPAPFGDVCFATTRVHFLVTIDLRLQFLGAAVDGLQRGVLS